ncbi:MAG: ChbG/HpnK family deacetylase [Candidatus Omnitrophica bacterium]|nr:ChbG/HpnK family deacetylase [Candidatus Omnitrophota bacterium]
MKYLIVSADDFGLSDSINHGIMRGCEEGIVTSVNVIPSGAAFYDAASLLRMCGIKELSAHLALTETAPVTDPDMIPGLLTQEGDFHKSYMGFCFYFLRGAIVRDEIYLELKNQLERLKTCGLPITSLSSHQHIHILPGIREIFIQLAKEYDIPSIRYLHNDKLYYPYRAKKIFRKMVLKFFDRGMKNAFDKAGICHTDNLLGFFDSGDIREELLLEMINSLKSGVTELVTHPGFISAEVLDRCIFHRNCETDLAALTSRRVKKEIARKGIKLISFSDLAKLRK